MIDLHCHLLPNTDDGPTSLEISLEMARFSASDGIRYIAVTPHCHRFIHLLRDDILPRVAQLNGELQAANIPLTVLPGSEIQVTDTREYRREFDAGLFCHLGDGRSHTLLEFNWSRELFPPDAVSLIEWINRQGMKPIIAHPERHGYFSTEPELLTALIDAGAWIQVTVDSLLGNHGLEPRVAGELLLKKYPEAILASDAHNLKRCSGLTAGYDWVSQNLGQSRADDLRHRANLVLASIQSEQRRS